MKLWLAGRAERYPENDADIVPWDFMGIYRDEWRAVARCTTDLDYVAPVVLDEDNPRESFSGAYYPTLKAF